MKTNREERFISMQWIKKIQKLNHSMIGYLPVKILEGIVGILTLKVYTSLFIPEVYGQYTIINQTIILLFLVNLGWVVQSTTRFTDQYKDNKEPLYSTIFITWFILIVSISIAFFLGNHIISYSLESFSSLIALLLILVFITYSLNQIILVLLYYSHNKMLSAILLVGGAIIKLILTVFLVKNYEASPFLIFVSHSIADGFTALIGFYISKALSYIRPKYYSKEIFKSIVKFGYPLIGLSLTMFALNVSDRYVIRYFLGDREVGLYASNYAIPSSIFAMIMLGLSRGMYRNILTAWNDEDHTTAFYRLTLGVKIYIMIALPAALGIALLSKSIARIFIDINYVSGYVTMGIVAFGMLFYGLTEYYNKGWELGLNTLPILIHSIVVAIINFTLNIIFVPKFGYIAAAYSTLLSFYIYLLIAIVRSKKLLHISIDKKYLLNISFACVVMTLLVLIMKPLIQRSIFLVFVIILVASVGYFGILWITGELKQLVHQITKEL